jgi:hypothetical protein
MRDFAIGDRDATLNHIGQRVETRTQDQAHSGSTRSTRLYYRRRRLKVGSRKEP